MRRFQQLERNPSLTQRDRATHAGTVGLRTRKLGKGSNFPSQDAHAIILAIVSYWDRSDACSSRE